ncbi:hypothetical protein GCM10027168_44940 [Streptomyces capparidis]
MSFEDALNQQGQALQRRMAGWDMEAFLHRLEERIIAEAPACEEPPAAEIGEPARHPNPDGRAPTPARPRPRTGEARRHRVLRAVAHRAVAVRLSDDEQLHRLCQDAIAVQEGTDLLEQFIATFNPHGARIFACMLYLADRAEHALFWWRFACGGEDGLAAYCLTLHSRAIGDTHQMKAWSTAACDLRFNPEQHWPQPSRDKAPDPNRLTACLRAHARANPEPDTPPEVTPNPLLPTPDLPQHLATL